MADIFKNALNTATQIDYNELNSDGSYRISDDDLMIKLSDANKNKDQNAINKINKAIEERTQKKFGKPSVQESQEMLNKGRIETAKQVSEVPVDQWNAIKQRIKDAKASDSDMATAYTMWKKGYYNEAGPKTLEWF